MRTLHPFPGGLKVASRKEQTRAVGSRTLTVPERLYLPLQQHIGTPATPCAERGRHVHKGEIIARSPGYVGTTIHAPTSGEILGVVDYPVTHSGTATAPCIELRSDGEDLWGGAGERLDCAGATRAQIDERLAAAGIVGLGGAGFPTQVKAKEGTTRPVELLIINGVECEPYITCDDRLLRERAAEVIAGARLISRYVDAGGCLIAIEDDMPDARSALTAALAGAVDVEVVAVPARYPAGSEKQLIFTLTGREVPSGELPIDIGLLVNNVATAAAVYRAVAFGEPLIERLVTVAGKVGRPGNVRALFGTPLKTILKTAEFAQSLRHTVLVGGPMMGVEVDNLEAPVTKKTNCIVVIERPDEGLGDATACIRCGDCVAVCPVGLQPQLLYELARAADFDATQDYHLFDCIECGCCAYVCPSRIPLVHFYRYAKSAIESLDEERDAADRAKSRFEGRLQRLAAAAESGRQQYEYADATGLGRAEMERAIEESVARERARRAPSDDQTGHDG